MWEWIRTAEAAELIFYGIFVGLILAEVVLRWVLRVPKSNVILEYVDSGMIAIVLALVIRTLVVQAFKIPSGSMETTLLVDDHLLVNRFIYGTRIPGTDQTLLKFRDPQRGDILVFRYPQNPRRDFIKRCIGLPGDILEVRAKTVYINGEPLVEPYTIHRDLSIKPPESGEPRDYYGPVTVPANSYFMMGDNRDQSSDSRYWGFLSRRLIKGKAWVIYWPFTRWRLIR